MRRATRAMWILYTAVAVGLLGCTLLAYQNHNWPGTAFFAAAAATCGLAVAHTSWLLDEYRHLLSRADADNRAVARYEAGHRPALTTRQDVEVRKILAADCCELWWATAGAEHDPEHCTRKDQTT